MALTLKRGALILLIAVGCALGWYAQSRLLAQRRRVRTFTTDLSAASGRGSSQRPAVSIRVGTFNIAHARGGEFGASNWTGGSKAEVQSRLAKIAREVSDAGIDVLVLNEVDFPSVSVLLSTRAIAAAKAHPSLRRSDVRIPPD
ncbi:MAG TPA: hypothetical protein VGS57_09285 [Thermoanaerobaculia bacterium]|jgi:hypothetical protein|nr:hypothetical protein [Thermoanaerobaculia bacterium]